MRTRQVGMTLVEVMLALVLGALTVLTARALLNQLGLAGETLGRVARVEDERRNETRVLYALLRHADVRPDSLRRFTGDSTSAQFHSLCQRPGGWGEPCDVTVLLDSGRDSTALVGQLSTGEVLTLGRWDGRAELRYLSATPSGDQWLSEWGRSIVAPAALALVFSQDTIVVPVAGR